MNPLPVTTAAEAAARDHAAIAAGIPGGRLMQRAGEQVAALLLRDQAARLRHGVTCWAGPGNNGGDAYVVAAVLARHGVPVRMHAVAPPRTDDAREAAARWAQAAPLGPEGDAEAPGGTPGVVVDGVLGTGQRAPLREAVAQACTRMVAARDGGAWLVALDLPTGVDADTGALAPGHVVAHETISFGSCKRGALLARQAVGRLRVVDIGLGAHAHLDDGAWQLADPATLGGRLPRLPWDAHKGNRGRVLLAGGAAGMAGAIVLGAEGALRAGAGLLTVMVAPESVPVLQATVPQALATPWPTADAVALPAPPHAVAVGPGVGRDAAGAQLLQRLRRWLDTLPASVPVVLDADALWHLATGEGSAAAAIAAWGEGGRPVVITPHVGECARLLGAPVPASWDARADAVRQLAQASGAVVLLKGPPTLVASPDGAPVRVMARGTPVLATGGSGDLLTGMVAALLAQRQAPLDAALFAATAHGVAAELVHQAGEGARGTLLADVGAALPRAWRQLERAVPLPDGVLLDLPAVA